MMKKIIKVIVVKNSVCACCFRTAQDREFWEKPGPEWRKKSGIHGTESDKKRGKNPEPEKKIPASALLYDIYV